MRYTSSYCDSDNVIVIVTAVRSVITNARRCTDQSYGTVYDGFRQDVGVVSSLKITINTFRKLNFFQPQHVYPFQVYEKDLSRMTHIYK